MSGRPGRPRRVRNVEGDREERVEEDSEVYVNVDNPRDPVVQRAIIIERSIFRAAAVCLTALCVLGVLRTTDKVMDYHSTFTELQTKYENMTLERDQWKTSFNNVTLERDQWKTSFNNMALERDQLQSEVNQVKRERAVKSCPSGWKKFGCSCYYKSTEPKTWEGHREQCLKTGADLVIINSQEEQEFIRGFPGDQYAAWIGLKITAGKWTWVDGTPLTTQYWGSGRPRNNGDDYCAAYSHTVGKWADEICTRGAVGYGICEKLYLS